MYKYIVEVEFYHSGSGYSHTETAESGTCEKFFPASSWNYADDPLTATDNDWYKVIVEFYAPDDDPAIDDPVHRDEYDII